MFRRIGRGLMAMFGESKASVVAKLISLGWVGRPVWKTDDDFEKQADEGYKKCITAYRCVNYVARAVSSVPWKLYKRTPSGKEEVEDHQMLTLLRRPAPLVSRTDFVNALMSYLQINGNAFIEGVGPTGGRNMGLFKELYTHRPDYMRVIPSIYGVAGYEFELEGRTKTWNMDQNSMRCDVHHIKLFNPLDHWYGLSPIEAAAHEIDIFNSYNEWNYNLLEHGAKPSGVYTVDNTLSTHQRKDVEEGLKKKHTGKEQVGKIITLEKGGKFTQFGFSPQDMDWIQGAETKERHIAGAFGVPPMLMGIPGDNKYANMQEAAKDFWGTTVLFYLTIMQSALDIWLSPRFEAVDNEDYTLEPDLSKTPIEEARKATAWERATGGREFMTINERRKLMDLDEVDGGDVIFVTISDIPLDMAGESLTGDEKARFVKRLKEEGYSDDQVKAYLEVFESKEG